MDPAYRSGAYPTLAIFALLVGTVATVRWGSALPGLVLAAEPVSDMDAPEELPPYLPDEEPVEGATDPVEELVEPEPTDTSPELVDPGATTAPAVAAPEIVAAPATTPVQTLPRGRWVLFDRNGQPVDAIVEPWCVEAVDDCPRFGAIAPSCVWVEYLGQLQVRVPFRLSDGDPDACYLPSGQDRDSWIPPPAEIAGALFNAPYSLELVYWD